MRNAGDRNSKHLNQNEIAAILPGALSTERERLLFQHWKNCPECRRRLGEAILETGTFVSGQTAENVRLYTIASNPTFHVACTDKAVVAAAFSMTALRNILRHTVFVEAASCENPFPTELASRIKNYFTFGTPLGRIPVHLITKTSTFMTQVLFWTRLIPHGVTVSYGDIARWLTRPGAARAVGQALHRNPFPVIIPCHRVLGRTGNLVGYSAGIPQKRHCLMIEGYALKS